MCIRDSFGAQLVSAGGITMTTGPTDPASNIALDSSWNGNGINEMIDQGVATVLAVGDSFVVQFTVVVDPDATGVSTPLENQVVAGGDAVDANGDPISATDDSDSGSDPNSDNPDDQGDHGTSDDPTPLHIADLSIAKATAVSYTHLTLPTICSV